MNYKELRKIDVGDHVEKKNGLSYLSWSWAVDTLLQHDPMATWEFPEPKYYGETVMVFCEVNAFGKTMKMHLPVMDYKNQAVKNPDSRKISDSQMRCLAKCIACFGIGLYLYSGEDLPSDDSGSPSLAPPFKPLVKTVNGEPVDENLKPIRQAAQPPKVEAPKAKVHVNANDGQWSIKTDDPENNMPAVILAAETLLAIASSEDDLQEIFQKNRSYLDLLKTKSPEEYTTLMGKFTARKQSLKKE